jgi:restriction system protein
MKEISKSKQIAIKTIYGAFEILKKAGGEMRGKEVIEKLTESISFNEYEKHVLEKTGNVRWRSVFHFYTIDCIKAGFLVKEGGIWILTTEGEKAMKKGPEGLLDSATEKYKEWSSQNKKNKNKSEESEEEETSLISESDSNLLGQQQQAILEQFEEKANDGIREFILQKGPYEFQNLVATLLSAMGFYISHISPPGPDGGIDVIAYTDPLGTKPPRIIVQVKHKPTTKISPDEIQKLAGTMKRSTDVGIFVTSGEFSPKAKIESRSSDKHIELIDFDRFISLWQEHYPKMSYEQKSELPIHPIYFLGSFE